MKITDAQYERIAGHFPIQRGNVKTENRDFINAILYMAENGCKWRALPKEYGSWSTIYKKFSRWAKNGVLQRVSAALQAQEIIAVRIEVLALDSTSVNREAAGTPSFMWYPQMIRSSLRCTFPAEAVTMHQKDVSQ